MSKSRLPTENYCEPGGYEIRLQGHLDDRWANWFDCLNIQLEENGDTLLTSAKIDQSALYGLLRKTRDVGLPLISVIRLSSNVTDGSDVHRTSEGE